RILHRPSSGAKRRRAEVPTPVCRFVRRCSAPVVKERNMPKAPISITNGRDCHHGDTNERHTCCSDRPEGSRTNLACAPIQNIANADGGQGICPCMQCV